MKAFDQAKIRDTKPKKKPWYQIQSKQYTYYIWSLPLVPIVLLVDKCQEWAGKRRVWSEEKATKVLDAVLPKVLEYVEEDNAYYYSMEWGTSALWRKAPRKYRKWAFKFEYHLKTFIRDGYENTDYTKTIEKDYYETWIKFVEK
jgi:hypothetical protein